jgi:hypothetical protein
MKELNKYFLDLRDFSYLQYVKKYGRVSARSWPGYKGIFYAALLPYYLLFIMIVGKALPNEVLSFIPKGKPSIITLIIGVIVMFVPYVYPLNIYLSRMEKKHQLIIKSIEPEWERKRFLGWATMVGGFVLILVYAQILKYF